jgi:hypothetical protein
MPVHNRLSRLCHRKRQPVEARLTVRIGLLGHAINSEAGTWMLVIARTIPNRRPAVAWYKYC